MTQTYWPFDNADTLESQYSQMMRKLMTTGVYGTKTDTALKVTGDSSGLNVKLASGFAYVRGYNYYNDAVVSVTVAIGETQPRIDLVVLRVDPSLNTVVPAVVKGTANASPSAPALTQTEDGIYELLLAQINVPANATTFSPSTVVDKRTFMGHIYGLWETATRPVSPRPGQPGFNLTTGKPEFHDGSSWKDLLNTDASILTGVVPAASIPALDASKITTGTIAAGRLPTIAVNAGGTGATTAAQALTNLGAAADSHTHDGADISSGTIGAARLPTIAVNKGGTGATDATNARLNLGLPPAIFIQQADPGASGKADKTLWFSWAS